jgi:hypothetical protein
MKKTHAALALALALLLTASFLLAACGGSGDSSTESTSAAAPTQAQAPSAATGSGGGKQAKGEGSGAQGAEQGSTEGSGKDRGGAAKPEKPASLATNPKSISGAVVTSTGAVQTLPPSEASHDQALQNSYASIRSFGEEASGSEATEITFAMVQYLNARAQGDWATACARLYSVLRENLSNLAAKSEGPAVRNGGCQGAYGKLMERGPNSASAEEAKVDVASVRREGERAFVIYKTPATLSADLPMYLQQGVWTVGALEAYVLTPEQLEENR